MVNNKKVQVLFAVFFLAGLFFFSARVSAGWTEYLWSGTYNTTDSCEGGSNTLVCNTLNGTTAGCPAGWAWSECGGSQTACYVGFSPCNGSQRCADKYTACGCHCLLIPAPAPGPVCQSNYGNACTSANPCGQTNSGTIDCAGNCTAVAPPNPSNYGNACTSANSCGQTNLGTINCSGNCTAAAPPNSNCPSCTLSSSDSTVWKGETVTLSWTTTNATSATINGINATPAASGSMVSPQINSPAAFSMNVSGYGGTGACGPVNIGLNAPPLGGLVPCGRIADNLVTADIDESKPCDLCAAFYMLKKIINFATELAVGIAIFIIVIAGLLYVFSAGDPGKIELAKSAITYALTGLAIIFAAWLVIAIVLQSLGYADINTWNQVNCVLQK